MTTTLAHRLAHDGGFSEAEVAAMTDDILKSTDVARAEDDELADRLLSQAWRHRTFLDVQDNRARIQTLTPAEVLAALRRHIAVDRMSMVVAGSLTGSRNWIAENASGAEGAPAIPFQGRTGPTIWLKVTYLKPTPINERLRFEGAVDSVAGRRFSVKGSCYRGDERISEAEGLILGSNDLPQVGEDPR